ncbi:MAG: tRNA pseudouridine(38-40) synthase TruA [Firmicutes bacterium]|nr:tRNA pseudouridine(38-40) synthase TruA [Bacillota bacterium]
MRNIKLTLAYDGTSFAGFQVQPNARTVQGELMSALATVLGEKVHMIGAGRTDTGVHARGQVVSFKTNGSIPTDRLPMALNSILPAAIVVWQAENVPLNFHARYDATEKTYRYLIHLGRVPSPFIKDYSWHTSRELNVPAMQQAAAKLVGRHDFSAFCAAGSAVRSKVRTIRHLNVEAVEDLVLVETAADGFLYKMVRSIVGTLVEVGRGALTAEEVQDILLTGDRSRVGPTAPPQGLILWHVSYGPEATLEQTPGSIGLTLPWGYVKISL